MLQETNQIVIQVYARLDNCQEIFYQGLYKSNNCQINDEINALPCKDEWGTRKEIAELPSILRLDEEIKAMTSGLTEGNTWLIVCTNKRVLMLDKGMIYGLKLIDMGALTQDEFNIKKKELLGIQKLLKKGTVREYCSFFSN